jgi:TPR repeat protein
MYYSGDGVRQSFPEAVKYYRLAADQGSALAQASLADMYRSGVGLPQDHIQALRLYREAAERGNAGAMHNIGWFYAEGIVVEVDFVQAYSWYHLAIARWKPWQKQQRKASIHHRDLLGKFMTNEEVADAMRLANAWRQTKVDPPL